ncbi:MAG: tetratricopeptide repeat protein, partial [Gemmatimonadaceae bacterium]
AGAAAAAAPAATADPYALAGSTSRLRQSRFLALGAAAVAILAIAGAMVWLLVGRGGEPAGLQAARQAYAAGLRDSARAVFAKVALENQDLFTPFLYLGRIAREQGDFPAAARHLTRAAQLAPDSVIVHRELGSFFLARANYHALRSRPDLALGDYNAARRSFVRAVQLDPHDAAAKGYLGCALVRAGRPDEGARWLSQAGDGPWRQCAPAVQGLPPRPPQ